MGVKRKNTHVKFDRTIRLGKNLDLDNAVTGEVESGSLRDTSTNVQRWNGVFWENIGSPLVIKQITSADSPYSIIGSDDIIEVDTSGGDVDIILFLIGTLTRKSFVIKKIDSSTNIVTLNPTLMNTIDDPTSNQIVWQHTSLTISTAIF